MQASGDKTSDKADRFPPQQFQRTSLVPLHPGNVPPGHITKGQRRAQVDATRRVPASKHAGHVGTCSIQPRDRLPGLVQHAGTAIGAQPGKGAKAARLHLHRIERPMLNGRYTRVGPFVLRVALFAVKRCGTTAECRVLAVAGVAVEVIDRGA